jgi:glycosyltransferase involved in cell wall biosynthesis
MNILFITAHKYLPQMRGGLQSSADDLCRSLVARGHRVAVLAGLMPAGAFALKARIKMQINGRLFGCKVTRETGLGYPVWYSWFPWEAVEHVERKEKPDLIVVMAMQAVRMALAAKSTGIPILIQLQDVEFMKHGGNFEDIADLPCVANSRFTAETYHMAFGVNASVIAPFVSKSKYRTETSRENVTFINPFPEKGRDIALAVARRCPEIPFTFVEAWPLTPESRQELVQKLSALPNVMLSAPQDDMRKVYGKCKILLVPSIWEEAYGRVVTEAQMSGIPVVASARGGLPEAVGPGGILLNPEGPIDEWVTATRQLWQDQRHYAELSAAAITYASRSDVDFDYQIGAWERAMVAALPSPAKRAANPRNDNGAANNI